MWNLDRNVLAQLSVKILIAHDLVQGHWLPTTIHSGLIYACFSLARLIYSAKIACASSYDFLAMGGWFPCTSGLFIFASFPPKFFSIKYFSADAYFCHLFSSQCTFLSSCPIVLKILSFDSPLLIYPTGTMWSHGPA